MTNNLMTPDHPRWDEFLERLSGPDGCDLKEIDGNRYSKCSALRERPFASAVLKDMGMSVQASLTFFNSYGGYCDCEIFSNVSSSYESDKRKASLND